jgi:hypothetical protein
VAVASPEQLEEEAKVEVRVGASSAELEDRSDIFMAKTEKNALVEGGARERPSLETS